MIKTNRLKLRMFKESDVDAYYAILKQSEVYQWLGKGEEKSIEQVRKIINYDLEHWKKHKIGTWAVVLKSNNTLIGHCGFNYVNALNQYELLYAFDPKQWGNGYALEASKAALSWIKQEKKFSIVVALSYPNNERSKHVIEKLGFDYIETKSLFGVDLFVYRMKI